jgi:hypothetical protein
MIITYNIIFSNFCKKNVIDLHFVSNNSWNSILSAESILIIKGKLFNNFPFIISI